jgi:hypothetical protein
MATQPNGPRSGSLRMPASLRSLAGALTACGLFVASPSPVQAHPQQARDFTFLAQRGSPSAPASIVQAQSSVIPALASSGKELAQPARPERHAVPRQRPPDRKPARSVAPVGQAPLSEPAEPEPKGVEQSSDPEDEGEVSPGEDPASCDGCELAMISLGGTLWGLFGVSRRRGVPRPVIRGLQPR